ncbi:sensor histidine kinase [Reichenbachiella ulvae]|uniref:Histidine kinase n=1 Tax=Reichenbachiella ulvae TaxID=2980104 RepID=A0ABT3CWY9_9BACT|nr:histidine kinase [Reichenbachiella ulvae]MCV9388220.1 histidine kinase [Reichenbachiella ulvae]
MARIFVRMGKLESIIRFLFQHRWASHIFFWLSYVCFYAVLWGSYDEQYLMSFNVQLMFLPVKILVTYYTLYILLPKYILRGRWLPFIFLFIASSFTGGTIYRLIAYYIEYPLYYPEYIDGNPLNFYKIIKGILGIYTVVFLALVIKLLKYWYQSQQDRQILAHEKLDAELKFLKTQIHPHFLFNTLNNLYALTLKKSDYAPEVVLKLSDLINYMLYECNAPKVLLDNELNFIKNYIEIEQMRHGDDLDIKAMINGDSTNVYIAPMILLPFVENSFKHGINEELNKSWIDFDLTVTDHEMILKLANSKSQTQQLRQGTQGIGLKNVKRRLELLYKNDYHLHIDDQPGSYTVVLRIALKKVQ